MKVPPVLFREEGPWGMRDISVAGALGLLLSLALGLRVLWSIRKSGHLDSEDG
jgi:ubiquinone biosynthesis protein